MSEQRKLKIEFAPGCFDDFDGTQEELDEMINSIKQMFEGRSAEEIQAMGRHVSIDELMADDSISDDDLENIIEALVRDDTADRKLH